MSISIQDPTAQSDSLGDAQDYQVVNNLAAIVSTRCQPAQNYVWSQFDRSDWMGQQRPNLSNRRLLDLMLPGSHDTGTYSIPLSVDTTSIPVVSKVTEAVGGAAVTQNAYLADQLAAGIRYINLRPGNLNGQIYLFHGSIPGFPFSDFVAPIPAFCRAHPSEFLIIYLENGNGELTDVQKQQVIGMLTSSWGPLMINSSDTWFNLASVVMGDIWNRQSSQGDCMSAPP